MVPLADIVNGASRWVVLLNWMVPPARVNDIALLITAGLDPILSVPCKEMTGVIKVPKANS